MINALLEYLKNKKILILGFGMEGYSTYLFIRKYLKNQKIYVSDIKSETIEKYKDVLKDTNVEILDKKQYLKQLEDYDIIMKSPGISFANIDTTKFINKIKSQLELFLEFINVFTIGITGTKGKSTTSSLIYEMIKEQCEDVHLLGNIGIPLFDEIDKLNENSIVVLELSSHQLEFAEISPNIAILLNVFEEHLDHYKSYDHYINSKLNICRYQKENDYFLYNSDNEVLRKYIKNMGSIKSKIYEISYLANNKQNDKSELIIKSKNNIVSYNNKEVLYTDIEDRKLLGNHNLNNIMFAITVAKIMNLDLKKAQQIIYDFKPLPHRMEYVGEFDGIRYYNDSIATVPESTINAIETLKNVNTLIVGGKDRGIDFTAFIQYLNNSNIKNLICMPDTGWIIGNKVINKNICVQLVDNMEEAVKFAKINTEKGNVCLLSPAASSYGFFKNFKERGNLFKELVTKEKL